jgi:hypothetical protein
MGRIVAIILAFAFVLFLVGTMTKVENKVDLEFGVSWAMRTMGSLIAVIAAAAILLQSFAAAPTLSRLSPFVFALFGGLVLVNQHWSALLAFTLLSLAMVVKEIVGVRTTARQEVEGTA